MFFSSCCHVRESSLSKSTFPEWDLTFHLVLIHMLTVLKSGGYKSSSSANLAKHYKTECWLRIHAIIINAQKLLLYLCQCSTSNKFETFALIKNFFYYYLSPNPWIFQQHSQVSRWHITYNTMYHFCAEFDTLEQTDTHPAVYTLHMLFIACYVTPAAHEALNSWSSPAACVVHCSAGNHLSQS